MRSCVEKGFCEKPLFIKGEKAGYTIFIACMAKLAVISWKVVSDKNG